MIRLFVGLELPEQIRRALAGLQSGIPGARWVAPENLHITLRFIGDVPDDQAEDIDTALRHLHAPAFTLEISGVGHFGKGRNARAIWAGIDRNPALERLNERVETALLRAGLPPETRKFSAHVTLARMRAAPIGRVRDFLAAHGPFRAGPVAVDSFALFSSILGREGPVYHVEAEYPLIG